MPTPTSRRSLLSAAAGAAGLTVLGPVLSGCGGSSVGSRGTDTSSTAPSTPSTPSSSSTTPAAAAPTGPALPATTPWQPAAAEVRPAVKLAAVRLLEALGTWAPGGSGPAPARARAVRLGHPAALADQAGAELLGPGRAAVVQVVDAQYGGILSSSSSVLVVLRQWRLSADGSRVVEGGTTVDVRLVAASPRWRVTALHPARPLGAATPEPSAVQRLLAQPRLRLPVAARADLRSGTISAGTMAAMGGLAAAHVVDVSVVRSGHPLFVFGTSRHSDHPRGHAFDVWAVDGRPVVDPANRGLVERVMRLGIQLGAWQVGGPVDLDGGGSSYFSDATHHDHVHLGFRG